MSNHLPREGREQRLLSRVRAILKGGGRCLLPVVALGRAQVPILARPFAGPVTELVESPQDRNACNTLHAPCLVQACSVGLQKFSCDLNLASTCLMMTSCGRLESSWLLCATS